MALLSKYITADDFLQFAGENLSGNLVDGDNPSDKENAFIYRIETRLSAYLNANFHQNVDEKYPEFTDYQKEQYKLALLEQCLYVYKNGDISVDSGYEQESGIVAERTTLKSLYIAPNAKTHLVLCGLWSTHIDCNDGLGWWCR